jgi:hypothetical protein
MHKLKPRNRHTFDSLNTNIAKKKKKPKKTLIKLGHHGNKII